MTPRARFGLAWLGLMVALLGVALLSGDLNSKRRDEQRQAAIRSAIATSGVHSNQGNGHE